MDITSITKAKLAKMIDYGPQLADIACTEGQVRLSCAEAIRYGFAAVYFAPYYIPLVKKELKGKDG